MLYVLTFLIVLLLAHPIAASAQISLQVTGGNFAIPIRTFRDIPFRTVVRQRYDYSCGSAALATLLRFHYGRPIDEEVIFRAMYLAGNQEVIQKVGFSLLDMKNYLSTIGLEANGYRLSLDEVSAGGKPVITVITTGSYKHFVLIKGIRNGDVLIGDPASGLRRIKVQEFSRIWNGIAFEMTSNDPGAMFNSPGEWSPFAPSPIASQLDRASLNSIGTGLPVIYQVLQLTVMRPTQ